MKRHTVDETNVKVDSEDDGLLEDHGEWLEERHLGDLIDRHMLCLDFGLGLDLVVSGELTQTLGATEEDGRARRLRSQQRN